MTNATTPTSRYPRRVYPLDPAQLTEEQIAVTFAMTSRRPEPFAEIAQQVSQEKAADFNERWVLGYGHASVAEHAIVHLAVENISRLAADTLEDNRLASYTEKSSRYQVLPADYFHQPQELEDEPALAQLFRDSGHRLFQLYPRLIEGCLTHLRTVHSQREKERGAAYQLRLRRIATDSCRAILPAATLTQVGVTANARVLEHAISKLLSSPLHEERRLGSDLREQARTITPTLIKYADTNPYLQSRLARAGAGTRPATSTGGKGGQLTAPTSTAAPTAARVRLIEWDQRAEEKLAAALLFRQGQQSYGDTLDRVRQLSVTERLAIINESVAGLGPHDAPPREFELVDYTFELLLDYGAYREFKRHRMQSYFPQTLTVDHGYYLPPLLREAGLAGEFEDTLERVEQAYVKLSDFAPAVAQYLVTHAHYVRVLSKLNLRECYHLFKLRTSPEAHESIRAPMLEALNLARQVHPRLFDHLRLRG